jgi:hypothetical protein
MHRTLQTLGVLSLAAVISTAARAQAPTRVSQQQQEPQEVGPPMPAELAGTPRTTPAATNTKMSPMTATLTSAAKDIRTSARAGQLMSPRTHAVIAAGASQAVVSIMMTPTAESERQVRNAFSLSGLSEGDVGSVMVSVSHLLSDNDADQIRYAQKRYDEFMKRSPSWFSGNPPAEALAVEAILARMGTAEGSVRPGDRRKAESRTEDSRAERAKNATTEDRPWRPAPKSNESSKTSAPAKKTSLWRKLLPFV